MMDNPISKLYDLIENQNLWTKQLELKRNEILKQPGSLDTNLYFILSGTLRIYILDEEEITIRFGYQNEFIAALDSYFTNKPSDLIIQALRKTELKIISKASFQKCIDENGLRGMWTKMAEKLILQQMERERDILTVSPKRRYERVLERSPQLFQEIPHKYIASYLRMTPETLSRLKNS